MDNAEVIQLLKDSFELKRQQKYKHAMELLYKALSIYPDNPEILIQVADLHVLLENYSSAKAIYERLLEKTPDDVLILERLVEYYLDSHSFDKAKLFLSKFVLAYPSQKAYEVYLNAYLRMQEFAQVEAFYQEKGLETYNSSVLNKAYAIALYGLKKYEDAEKAFAIGQKQNQFDEDYQYYYAQTLYSVGKEDEAMGLLKPLLKNNPASGVFNLAGEIELSKQNFEQAICLFLQAVKLKYSGLYFYNLATAYFLNGQINEAKAFYVKAISASPEIDEYRYAQAYLYYKSGDMKKAQQIIEALVSRNPRFREAVLLKAEILFAENKYFMAEKVLSEFEFDKESDVEYLEIYAKISRALYKNHNAEEALEKLVKLNGNNSDNRFELARLYFDMGRYDKAAALIVTVIANNNNYVGAYVLAAKIYMKMLQFKDAIAMSEKALCLDLNNEDAYYLKALSQIGLKEFDSSIETAKQLLAYNPQKVEAYALIGSCYAEKQDILSAIKYYEEAVLLDSKNIGYLQALAVLHERRQDIKSAVRYLFMAHVLNPDNADITDRLINAYSSDKQYKHSLRLLRTRLSKIKDIKEIEVLNNRIREVEILYRNQVGEFKFLLWRLLKL